MLGKPSGKMGCLFKSQVIADFLDGEGCCFEKAYAFIQLNFVPVTSASRTKVAVEQPVEVLATETGFSGNMHPREGFILRSIVDTIERQCQPVIVSPVVTELTAKMGHRLRKFGEKKGKGVLKSHE